MLLSHGLITRNAEGGATEARYAALLDALNEGVVIQDRTGAVVAFNRRAPEILGVDPEVLVGARAADQRWLMVDDQGHPLAPERHPASIARLEKRPVLDVVCGVEDGKGERKWMNINAVPVEESQGGGVVVTFLDVTRRKIEHDRLAQNEREIRGVVDAVEVGMWIARDDQSGFEFVNDALCRLTGYSREELLAMSGADFVVLAKMEDVQLIKERGEARLRGEQVSPTLEVEITRKDGAKRLFVLSGTVIQVSGKAQVLVAITDITEAREAQRQQRELEKLESLAVLAGGVAHDFNNKLLTVMGNATLALMDMPASDPVRGYIEEIHRASTEAAHLSRQMLDYSGRGGFAFNEINIREILRALEDDPAVMAMGDRISIDAEQPLPPRIIGDGPQIRRLLLNLVTNAYEAFDDPDDTIHVGAEQVLMSESDLTATYLSPKLPAGRYLLLTVSDNGHGIPPEIIDRVFDPFFSTRFAGRGLGLAGALGIVRGHGGAIQVTSEIGVGTRFSVWLPISTSRKSAVTAEE